ncbi:MAG: arylsulfatase A-like enzyme, partial [Pseudohongiellaceae bacterium]
ECFADAVVEGTPPQVDDLLVIDWRFDRPFEPLPPEDVEEQDDSEGEKNPKGDSSKLPPDESDNAATETAGEEFEASDDPADSEKLADGEEPNPDGESEEDLAAASPGPMVHGVEALIGIEELRVQDGLLHGQVTSLSALRFERRPDGDDDLYGVEVRLKVSAGETISLGVQRERDLERKEFREDIADPWTWRHTAELTPGGQWQTCLIELPRRSAHTEQIRHLFLQPTDAEQASFEIESVRLVSLREHLAGQAANFDWRGLGEIYRQALLMHVTETVHFEVALPAQPWLELALGTTEAYPTTFAVHVSDVGADSPAQRVLRRTVTTEDRWDDVPIDLSPWADKTVRLTFSMHSENEAQVGFFGTAIIRSRGALPTVAGKPLADTPQGVIVVLIDTLRRDHLNAYGYERETAPYLAELANEGALFQDNISQASWTKVSVPSILSSMYPTTNGVQQPGDKLPPSVTTLAENFQRAGYATFATSSVPFTGRISNLQQGIDVLHERGSVGELDHSPSKTARTYVDRLAQWIDDHDEQPFFAFLHIFDPHSPFDTYSPYQGHWSQPGGIKAQKSDIEQVMKVDDDIRRGGDLLPDKDQLEAAGVSHEDFVARELDWYDESIRAMDAEIARLVERLEEAGLAERTLIAFTSDHGEEFLEHGRHFHGNHVYGELTNVPLMLWGPQWIRAGTVIEETVQNIDLYPTLLELAGLPLPEGPQGQSLVPLLLGTPGFVERPAFVARFSSADGDPEDDEIGAFAMVSRGFRLVHNVVRPEGHPEFELYDHVADPLNLQDIADAHPEKVAAMAHELGLWLKWTESQKVEGVEGSADDLSPEDLEQLKALGYLGG